MLVRFERQDHVAQITLAAPERQNRLDLTMIEELLDALEHAQADSEVRVAVISGEGERAFCAGADIRMFAATDEPLGIPAELRQRWLGIRDFPKPLIAAVNGYAFGGGLELILLCDVAIAAEHAQLGFTEMALGVFPGAGGSQLLPRAVGPRRAKELILSGRRLSATEALSLGLVAYCLPSADFRTFVAGYAQSMAERAPLALQAGKRAIEDGLGLPLDEAFALEAEQVRRVFATADRREGMRAFLEKRRPRFTGR